jgi:hypothetical protein
MKREIVYFILMIILLFSNISLILGSDEFKVNDAPISIYCFPSVAMDSLGNFIVVWDGAWDGSSSGIFAQRFDRFGNKVGREFQVNTYKKDDQNSPTVGIDESGNFVIAWSSWFQNTPFYGIFAQMYDNNGNPKGNEFQVNTYKSYNTSPRIAFDKEGNFKITWFGYDYGDWEPEGVFAQRFDKYCNPQGDEIKVAGYYQAYPSVDMDSDGDFVIAWESEYYDDWYPDLEIYAQRFNHEGNRIGEVFQVNTYSTESQYSPDIAMSDDGGFVITWSGSLGKDGSYHGVFAQRFDKNGNCLGKEFQVNTYTEDSQEYSHISMGRNGNFVITWDSFKQDGSADGVFAQRYDSKGSRIGYEFRVNDTTLNNQWFNDVAMDPEGDFVIIWLSGSWDYSDGIFAKLFSKDFISKPIKFKLVIDPASEAFFSGDIFKLLLDVRIASSLVNGDLYFILLNTQTNTLFFALDWGDKPINVLSNFQFPRNLTLDNASILEISIPSNKPPIIDAGIYTFGIAATEPGTMNFISNIATVSFEVK